MRLLQGALVTASLLMISAEGSSAQTQLGYLVHQDSSDCLNNDVREPADPSNMNGIVEVTRGNEGKTNLTISMTARPGTTYHFFLKCVRHLGDVKTDDEGTVTAKLSFNTNETGNVLAFDMYPEGAPAGNRFQSTQVKF